MFICSIRPQSYCFFSKCARIVYKVQSVVCKIRPLRFPGAQASPPACPLRRMTVALSDRFAVRLICQHPLRILPHLCMGVAHSKQFSYSCSLTLTRFMGFLQRIPFLRPYQSDSERSERSFVFQREARSFSRKTVFQRKARSDSRQTVLLRSKIYSYPCRIVRLWCRLPGR